MNGSPTSGVPVEARRRGQRPGTRVTDGFEPSCGCWDLNSGPLEE